ncbi:ATP-binding protein [Limnofasciculus baicalensis]|uniref:ATP-binding protein n=1 Tax=Limnofasciculus baicalensis TaxID=3064906 RepID=UPI002815852B|nr:ATP-binding protein [Limnofasciculus baicalensis]
MGNELKLDVYQIKLSAVLSKYIGESEKNLQRIFEAAAGANVILLFDEADALFGKRTEVKDSHDRYANMTISQLLQQIEKYRGLAILTTNMKDAIDRAFTRRLHFNIEFPFPDKEARIRIWKSMIPAKAPTQDLNFTRLGQLIISGGSIRNIVLNAAFMAADNGEPIMMKHILVATRSECVKHEKLLTDIEIRGWV